MKMNRRVLRAMALMCLLLMLPMQVLAAGLIDTGKNVSLTIYDTYQEKAIADVEFKIYQLCTVADNGEFTVTDGFRAYAAQLDIRGENDAAWRQLAQTLEKDILLGSVGDVQPAATALTDASGKASFASLAQGLYLVLGTGTELDGYVYSTAPMVVSLPTRSVPGDDWIYDVTAYAKPEQQPVQMPFEVVKVWKDEGYTQERPQSICVQLYCDGKPYGDPITLPVDGKWAYTWDALDVNHLWTVEEAPVEGYRTPVYERDGNTFIITNTYDVPTTPVEPTLPQTGQLWWPVPVLIAAGLLFIVLGLVVRRQKNHAE